MTRTPDLVDVVVALLAAGDNGATDANKRVYAPRDWPSWNRQQYPVLFVSAPNEQKVSQGRAGLSFTTTATVRISARVSSLASTDDAAAGSNETALWALQRQIEMALIGAPALMGLIQQYPTVTSQMMFDAEGAKQFGQMVIDLGLEFYQGWEDFAPIASDTLSEITITPSGLPILDEAAAPILDDTEAGITDAPAFPQALDIILPE